MEEEKEVAVVRRAGKKSKSSGLSFKIQPPLKKPRVIISREPNLSCEIESQPEPLLFEECALEWEHRNEGDDLSLIGGIQMVQLAEWLDENASLQEQAFVDSNQKKGKKEKKSLTGKRKAKVKTKAKAKKIKKKNLSKMKPPKKKSDAGGTKKKPKANKTREVEDGNGTKGGAFSLMDRLRTERLRSKCDDPRFSYCPYPIDGLTDLKVSLVINLYPNGFSLGGASLSDQGMSYPYDDSTGEFVRTIDYQRLPPDFVELLEDVPCQYYDGCLLVEVRDFRSSPPPSSLNPGLATSPTRVHRVLLRPDTETLINDVEQICAEHEDWATDDCLKVEQTILQAVAGPVCLDPSPKVARVANIMHYNKAKAAFRASTKRSKSLSLPLGGGPDLDMSRTTSRAVPPHSSFALLNFLNQKSYRPKTEPGFDPKHSLPASKQSLKELEKLGEVSLPNPSIFAQAAAKSAIPQKRAIRFHGRDGRTYCYFELRPRLKQNGYEAVVSEGMAPEHSRDTAMKFPIGNSRHADAFFHQVKTLNTRDGRVCIFDSTANRPMPMMHNLKPVAGVPQGQLPLPIPTQAPQMPVPQGPTQSQLQAPNHGQPQGQTASMSHLQPSAKISSLAHAGQQQPHLGNGVGQNPQYVVGMRQGNMPPTVPSHRPPSPSAGASLPATSGSTPSPSQSHGLSAPPPTIPASPTIPGVPAVSSGAPMSAAQRQANLLVLSRTQPALYNQIINAAQQRSQQARTMQPRPQQAPSYSVERAFLHPGYSGSSSVPYGMGPTTQQGATGGNITASGGAQPLPSGVQAPSAGGVSGPAPALAQTPSSSLPLLSGYPGQRVMRHAVPPQGSAQGLAPGQGGAMPPSHPHPTSHGHGQPSMMGGPSPVSVNTNRGLQGMQQQHGQPQQGQPSAHQLRQAIHPQNSATQPMARQGIPLSAAQQNMPRGMTSVGQPLSSSSMSQQLPRGLSQTGQPMMGQGLPQGSASHQVPAQFHRQQMLTPQQMERKFLLDNNSSNLSLLNNSINILNPSNNNNNPGNSGNL